MEFCSAMFYKMKYKCLRKKKKQDVIQNNDKVIKKQDIHDISIIIICVYMIWYETKISQEMKQSAVFDPVHLSVDCHSHHSLKLGHRGNLISFNIRYGFKEDNT